MKLSPIRSATFALNGATGHRVLITMLYERPTKYALRAAITEYVDASEGGAYKAGEWSIKVLRTDSSGEFREISSARYESTMNLTRALAIARTMLDRAILEQMS